jgi:hypothetical protein
MVGYFSISVYEKSRYLKEEYCNFDQNFGEYYLEVEPRHYH